MYLFLHFLPISTSLCQLCCFPTQEASVVSWDHQSLCDHYCSSSCALLPCLVSSMPILWLDLLSSGAKNTKITIFPPLLCSFLHLVLFHSLFSKTHVTLHFVMSLLKAVTHSFVDYVSVSMTLDFYWFVFFSPSLLHLAPSCLSVSLCLSLVPISMWTLARVFIRGLPAELQQAFPGEEATGSRRMIKLGHYWASIGPQGSLPPLLLISLCDCSTT